MSYIKKKSQKQEQNTAKLLKGRAQIASGALWGLKGDVRTEDYLIENKFTDSDYYSLKLSIWNKIEKEAVKDNLRTPLMQIDIQEDRLVVLDLSLFYDLFNEYNLNIVADISTEKKSFRIGKTLANRVCQETNGYINYAKMCFMENHSKNLAIISLDNFIGINE